MAETGNPDQVEVKRPKAKGYYILPNLFTSAGLFAGFYAIVMAMDGKFDNAAMAIFFAMITDSMDGRVARLTNTQSAFGVQYDSLSDMVSFGVAPALVMYVWALQPLGKLGWIAAFIYAAGAALRLARFNVQVEVTDKRFFTGLPSPAAAALMAGFVWVAQDGGLDPAANRWVAWGIAVFAGITMVSNIRYWSFKVINYRKTVPFAMVGIPLLVFLIVSAYPSYALFGVFVAYAVSGYLGLVIGRREKSESAA